MIPIIITLSAFALCGCENEESVPAETSVHITEAAAVTSVSEISGTVSGRSAVTFASAETEKTETTIPETEEAETVFTEIQLAENQLDHKGRDFYLLMEFTGAEPLKYYPKAINPSKYRGDEYVLHSKFTITNLSKKSFDFIPQKVIIYGRHKNDSAAMIPITARDTGLVASDGYYTVEAGDTVSFDVDFVGKEVCIDYAHKMLYTTKGIREPNNVDAAELNNVSAAEFEITKRIKVKNAVKAAKNLQEEKNGVPEALVPREGEYSVLTHKNSYCFTAEPVVDGRYVKIALRVQCLTGKPETFEPRKFKLYSKSGDREYVYRWSFDPLLVKMLSGNSDEKELEGVSETLYDTPWELYVRSDGSAEYTMYFSTPYDMDASEFYKFCYEGENGDDVFECIINMEEDIQ